MKKILITALIFPLFFSGTGLIASQDGAKTQVNGQGQKKTCDEINPLNSMPGSGELLRLSGGRCWQDCAADSEGRMICRQKCDESVPENSGANTGAILIGAVTTAIALAVLLILLIHG